MTPKPPDTHLPKTNEDAPNNKITKKETQMGLAYRVAYSLEFKKLEPYLQKRVLDMIGKDSERDVQVEAFVRRVIRRAENPEGIDV